MNVIRPNYDINSEVLYYLKQYNNNYRPIYHLENIFLTITNELCN